MLTLGILSKNVVVTCVRIIQNMTSFKGTCTNELCTFEITISRSQPAMDCKKITREFCSWETSREMHESALGSKLKATKYFTLLATVFDSKTLQKQSNGGPFGLENNLFLTENISNSKKASLVYFKNHPRKFNDQQK